MCFLEELGPFFKESLLFPKEVTLFPGEELKLSLGTTFLKKFHGEESCS
jgi:hypothetical protein